MPHCTILSNIEHQTSLTCLWIGDREYVWAHVLVDEYNASYGLLVPKNGLQEGSLTEEAFMKKFNSSMDKYIQKKWYKLDEDDNEAFTKKEFAEKFFDPEYYNLVKHLWILVKNQTLSKQDRNGPVNSYCWDC